MSASACWLVTDFEKCELGQGDVEQGCLKLILTASFKGVPSRRKLFVASRRIDYKS
jgi:hypothetical protein